VKFSVKCNVDRVKLQPEETARDLHSLGRVPWYTRQQAGGEHTDAVKNMSCIIAWPSFLWSPFVCCSVYNTPKVKLMHSSNHTKHYRK